MISDDLLQEIEGEIHANRPVTIRDLHHIIPEVSKTTIHEDLTEKLGYTNLCARWVPKMLMDDHKTKRMGSELKFLTRYAQAIHSQCRFCKLKMLYMFKTFVSLFSGHASCMYIYIYIYDSTFHTAQQIFSLL